MRLRARGVTTFLQTFILIGVAIGGTFAVYKALGAYERQSEGPALMVSGASIKQGPAAATEELTISNVGPGRIASATILNPGISASGSYCYTVWNPVSGAMLAATCPALSSNPTSIQVGSPLPPSASVVVQVVFPGGSVFSQGSVYPVVVVSSNGAQSSFDVVAGQA